MKKNVYTVGQVNQYISSMFLQDFLLKNIWIRGEVSNWNRSTSGHIFFSLKDKTGVISAVMFSGDIRTGLGGPVKNGDEVEVRGGIRVYEKNGRYQLYAKEITPAGAGILYQRFEALKKELEEMGMFADAYKKKIPAYPRTVGVVTAPTGAAIRDIQTISARRNPFVQMILYPAQVQGEGAAESVAAGIRALAAYGVDVIIIGRGGGSIEDLWAFNEELLARQIFSCSVPVVSAVGHETDTTIADYVADRRAPTPSAAAEIVVPDLGGILAQIEHMKQALTHRMSDSVRYYREKLTAANAALQLKSPQWQLQNRKQFLAEWQDRAEEALKERIRQKKSSLERLALRLPAVIREQITADQNRLETFRLTIPAQMERILNDRKHISALYASRLDAVSPLKKLSGGYGFLEAEDGTGIRSVEQVREGDVIRARVADGSFRTRVTEIEKRKSE